MTLVFSKATLESRKTMEECFSKLKEKDFQTRNKILAKISIKCESRIKIILDMQILLITSIFLREWKASLLPGITRCWKCEEEDIISLPKSRRVNGLEKCCGTVYQFSAAHERTSRLPSLWNDQHCSRKVMAAMKSINYSNTRKEN